MADTLTLEGLKKKHADVFDNPAVQRIATWREPILGDGLPPVPTDIELSKRALLILLSKR